MAVGKRPNFLVIVADDLGFSDCSCFGSEIQTPNIDSLAEDGLKFTSFHVAAACSPTRSMLMTGTDHHIAGLGALSELVRSSPAHQGQRGYEGYLNDRVVAVPELLSEGGYWTAISGKWHLGLRKEHGPSHRGFQKSFALLPGCANHYGWEPQYEDVVHEPPRFFETAVTALHAEDGEYLSTLPKNFYSSDFYASKLLDFLSHRSDDEKVKPFFAYLPFSAPHWPLQAPEECCAKYRGQYSDGPGELRLKRLESLKRLGLVAGDVKPHDVVVVDCEPEEWSKMDPLQREKSARAMETYAGMVDRMDENIGRVIEHLKEAGEYDNTYILFMSDNGAEGSSYEALPLTGPDIMEHIERYYDNSLDNIGRFNSFVWYGCRWAQAATAPSRLFKQFSTQGGCRVPLVVKPAASSKGRTGLTTDAFCTVQDIVPTVLELAGLTHPGETYHGRKIAPLRGVSWKPYLDKFLSFDTTAGTAHIHPDDHSTGFENAGSGAVRRGRYKITFVPKPRGPHRWELFDLQTDPGETADISLQEPDVFRQLLAIWEDYKNEVGVVDWESAHSTDSAVDEYDDFGKWTKFVGKSDIPVEVAHLVPS